jgi:hypothetical protein
MDDTSPNTDTTPQMPADSPGSASDAGLGIGVGSNSVPQAASNLVLSSEQMPAPSPAAPPATFDPMANGPQPPALEPRLAAVATIADPHLRQHVEANVRLQTQRQVTAFTEAQRQAKAQAKQVIDQGGDLSTIPAKLMLQIDTPGRLALRDYVLAHANPATDPATYYGLKNQALDDTAAFQAVDLSNHMARLKPADYAELQQLQTSLNNNQPPADLPLLQAYKANTDHMLRQFGLPTGTTASPDSAATDNTPGAQSAALLRQAVDRHVVATEIATGRKMTPDDHHDLLQQIAAQQQSQAVSGPPIPPAVAGTAAAPPISAWQIGAAELRSGIAAIGGTAAGSSLAATIGPILLGAAGILVATTKSTASPALDEAPQVHDVPNPENGVARSEDSDGPSGAEINESSKKDYKRKRDAAEAASKAKATSGASAPPPDQQEPDKNKKQPAFKRPNDDLEFGDQIDLKRFTKRVILDENPNLKTLEDPDSGYRIQKDTGGHGRLAPKEWKLRDRLGRRVGSLDGNGRYLGN